MNSRDQLRQKIVEVLKETYDPEIPVNIYDLGLIHGINVDDEGNVEIRMTLTTAGCPLAGLLIYRVQEEVKSKIPEIKKVDVKIIWDPPWSPERITPEGRETLKKIYGYDVVEEWVKKYRS